MTGPTLRERLRHADLSAWELATYSASTRTGPLSRRDCPRTRALEGSPTMPAPSTRVNTGRRPAATPPRLLSVTTMSVEMSRECQWRRSGSLAAIRAATASWLGWTYRCRVASRLWPLMAMTAGICKDLCKYAQSPRTTVQRTSDIDTGNPADGGTVTAIAGVLAGSGTAWPAARIGTGS
jgi:hypothetical protein